MLKLNITPILLVLAISFFSGFCKPLRPRNVPDVHTNTSPEGTPTQAPSRRAHTQDHTVFRDVLYASPKKLCGTIRNTPALLDAYRSFMRCDPVADDVGKLRLLAYVLNKDQKDKKLVIERGKKITHPIFDKRPDLKAFVADKLTFYNVDMDAPLKEDSIKRFNDFKKEAKGLLNKANIKANTDK